MMLGVIDAVNFSALIISSNGHTQLNYPVSAFAHISNPCGHSFCGSCGRGWHMVDILILGCLLLSKRPVEKQDLSCLSYASRQHLTNDTEYRNR